MEAIRILGFAAFGVGAGEIMACVHLYKDASHRE